MNKFFLSTLISVFFASITFAPAAAQLGPATTAGLNADAAAAARRVMMYALQSGGNHGGCHPLPAGWSTLSATVAFPSSYGGYGGWVNNAELLPVSDNLSQFIKSHLGGAFDQPAMGSRSKVHTNLCAPAGFTYWLVVDSGMAKVAIGRVTLLRPGRAYHVILTAPPLGKSPAASAPAMSTTASTAGSSTASPSRSQAERLIASWSVAMPSLGMNAIAITRALLDLLHARPEMRSVRGIFIVQIQEGGWAASQGFQKYDVVTAVNNQDFRTVEQFERFVAQLGSTARFSIIRNKRQMRLDASSNNGWHAPSVGPGFVPPATPRP